MSYWRGIYVYDDSEDYSVQKVYVSDRSSLNSFLGIESGKYDAEVTRRPQTFTEAMVLAWTGAHGYAYNGLLRFTDDDSAYQRLKINNWRSLFTSYAPCFWIGHLDINKIVDPMIRDSNSNKVNVTYVEYDEHGSSARGLILYEIHDHILGEQSPLYNVVKKSYIAVAFDELDVDYMWVFPHSHIEKVMRHAPEMTVLSRCSNQSFGIEFSLPQYVGGKDRITQVEVGREGSNHSENYFTDIPDCLEKMFGFDDTIDNEQKRMLLDRKRQFLYERATTVSIPLDNFNGDVHIIDYLSSNNQYVKLNNLWWGMVEGELIHIFTERF